MRIMCAGASAHAAAAVGRGYLAEEVHFGNVRELDGGDFIAGAEGMEGGGWDEGGGGHEAGTAGAAGFLHVGVVIVVIGIVVIRWVWVSVYGYVVLEEFWEEGFVVVCVPEVVEGFVGVFDGEFV